MKSHFLKFFFASVLSFYVSTAQAQMLKLDEMITVFNSTKFPAQIFEMVEARGFQRIDKQWLPKCDRVIYYFAKEGNPSIFVTPMNCYQMERSAHYPKYFRNEMELQFQNSSRAEFETLAAQVKKQCKLLGTQNGTESGAKTKASSTAYRHEATETVLVIKEQGPVSFIYLIR